jgi:arginyl-tRNA synthetase
MTNETIQKQIEEALKHLGLETADFVVEHPSDLTNGDYSTNIALVLSKKLGKNPKQLAEEIAGALREMPGTMFERIEVAGPGFINFYLSKEFFKEALDYIIDGGESFGTNDSLKGEKVMVEYTDANPFKELHIGHLMSNTVGEAISRLINWSGAEVKRANYQGDVGLHVAKAVWGIKHAKKDPYPAGAKAYEENPEAKAGIEDINKKIYARSDDEINALYDKGREESLKNFEIIYKKLGTKFDYYFFESETAKIGKKIVEDNKGKIFEESDGAIVFKGENYDPSLHTRVFISSQGRQRTWAMRRINSIRIHTRSPSS